MSCLTGFSALMLTFSWSVTSSQAVYFQLFQHRLSPQKLRRGKPVVGCGRSHRLFNPAPPEARLISVISSGVHFFACAHLQQCNGADLRLWRNVFLEERKRGVRVRRFGWTWYPLRRDPKDAGKGLRFSLLHLCIQSGVNTFRPAALKVS